MKNLKRNYNSNLFLTLIKVLLGVFLWASAASVMSWLILMERLGETTAVLFTPLVQGLVSYLITTVSFLSKREKGLHDLLIAPLAYLSVQIVVTMLLWEVDVYGLLKCSIAVVCGTVLSVMTFRLRLKSRKKGRSFSYSR